MVRWPAERHIGWARPEAHDNHPWYSSALHNKVPRTYAYFRGFGVQQPEDPSPTARELRAAAHRTEYCVRMMLGAMFPANVRCVTWRGMAWLAKSVRL
jgi:hypothetical protein